MLQRVGGTEPWAYIWEEDARAPEGEGSGDYDPDGPGSPDWESVDLDGEAVWEGDDGMQWLSRHLIPADGEELTPVTLDLLQDDLKRARLVDAIVDLSRITPEADSRSWGLGMILRDAREKADAAKAAALAARKAELEAQYDGEVPINV
jgi:hypothetical protein